MKYLLTLILIFTFAQIARSQEKTIRFIGCSELKISPENFDEKIKTIRYTGKVFEKQLTSIYKSIGKAPYLSLIGSYTDCQTKLSGKLNARQSRFYRSQLSKTHSAYQINQGNNTFYINAFDSANFLQWNNCDNCEVKVKLIVFEIRIGREFFHTPFIKSIVKVNVKN